MAHLGKAFNRLATYSLRRGVRRDQFRVGMLKGIQLRPERVVLNVRNLRACFNVVEAVMARNLLAQPLGSFCKLIHRTNLQTTPPIATSIVTKTKRIRITRSQTIGVFSA